MKMRRVSVPGRAVDDRQAIRCEPRVANRAALERKLVYSAAWEGSPIRLFTTRLDSPEFASMPLASADLLSISASAKMAIRLRDGRRTLAEVSFAGGAPRELLNDVEDADWALESWCVSA